MIGTSLFQLVSAKKQMSVEKHSSINRPLVGSADFFFWAAMVLLNGLLFLPAILFLEPEHFFSFNLEVSFALILWAIFASHWSQNRSNWFWRGFLFLLYFIFFMDHYTEKFLP